VRPAGAIAQVFLHSGPWALAIAVAGVYYAAISPRPAYLWSVVGGLGLALAFVAFATLRALWRQRSVQPQEHPLTPERFLTLRRRFFWRNSLFFAVAMPAGIAFTASGEYERGFGFLLFVFLAGGLTGWLWSWFMWQWVGEALKVKEKARQRREQENAV
jgi:hypothetical protein